MGNHTWHNWSGSVVFTSGEVARPSSADEVAPLITRATERGQVVRPVGSGHSSMPLVATDDVLLSLEHLTGVVDHDTDPGADRHRATVLPGTGLADLGYELGEVGLEMENLGDVNYQAIAGAIGTGTHGTGETLPNLSATMVGGTLVAGTGERVAFGEDADGTDPDLTRAAQVSLGALGVLTSLTLRVRPAYELHRRNWITHVDWVLDHFDELAANHRHVDFYWYPRSDHAQVRVLDEPDRTTPLDVPGRLKTEEIGPAHEIIPNDRDLKYEEMEYLVPRADGLSTFRAVRDRVKERHRADVGWRVLVRTIAADDAMLSPTGNQPAMSIAVMQNVELDHEAYFADMEALFLAHGGRPHWGKKHNLGADRLRGLYRELDDFAALRRRLDPHDVFLNDHLRHMLEGTT